MEEYQLRDDVRGVEISPVTSADTVYMSDRRLSGIVNGKQDIDKMQSVISASAVNYPSSKAVMDYAASKAQVTRIALNVGFADKIKDTATTLEDLSNKVSIINVIDGDRIAGCILPSSQTGQIGWLYEFEEGWMLTKDVSSYEVGEHTWEDLLWYLDANSSKIMTYERMLETTGDKSQLTTTDKSNLVNAINEVKQGGGGGGSEWELKQTITIDGSEGNPIEIHMPEGCKEMRIMLSAPASSAANSMTIYCMYAQSASSATPYFGFYDLYPGTSACRLDLSLLLCGGGYAEIQGAFMTTNTETKNMTTLIHSGIANNSPSNVYGGVFESWRFIRIQRATMNVGTTIKVFGR